MNEEDQKTINERMKEKNVELVSELFFKVVIEPTCDCCPFWNAKAFGGHGKCARCLCSGQTRWRKDFVCKENKFDNQSETKK